MAGAQDSSRGRLKVARRGGREEQGGGEGEPMPAGGAPGPGLTVAATTGSEDHGESHGGGYRDQELRSRPI